MICVPKLITHNGITDSHTGWARRVGVTKQCLNNRFRSGWTVAEALTTDPVELERIRYQKRCKKAREIEERRRERGTHRNGYTGPVQQTHRFAWEAEREPLPQPPEKQLPGIPLSIERIIELRRRAEAGEELFGEADRPQVEAWGAWE